MDFPENTTIVSQNKQQIGVTTGAMYACQMSGCRDKGLLLGGKINQSATHAQEV